MKEGSSLKVRIQKLGTALSNMVMPNIPALIAWGVLTALFIPDGYFPNPQLNLVVSPMLVYLIPLLIGFTGGSNVYEHRGGVVGAIATFGAIAGTQGSLMVNSLISGLDPTAMSATEFVTKYQDILANGKPNVTMIIGAMIMGPLGAWCIKKFDQVVQPKIKTGFEMLVNNFSAGLIGFGLLVIAYFGVGPVVATLTEWVGHGVEAIVNVHLLPLASIIIEPAKILFLNNALNHGIFTPLGTEQVAQAGKSVFFLLEANPGPGLGILLAYAFFGRGSAKASSWGAMLIHFFGGIHEIYFPYVMMKPAMFLAVIAGGVSGTFTFELLDAGLKSPASPGSIIAIMLMAPKGIWPHLTVLIGILVAAAVSFIVASIILKADKSEGASLEEAQAATQAAKAESKGQSVEAPIENAGDITTDNIQRIIFACDAGMGSSAMGASILRDKVKKAGIDIPVTNQAISNLKDTDHTLIVTQEELAARAAERTPRAVHVTVDNFLATPKYDELVGILAGEHSPSKEQAAGAEKADSDQVDLNYIDEVVFAYGQAEGSATMGQATLGLIFKTNDIGIPISKVPNEDLGKFNAKNILIVTSIANQTQAHQFAQDAQYLVVDSLVTTPEYDKMVHRMHK